MEQHLSKTQNASDRELFAKNIDFVSRQNFPDVENFLRLYNCYPSLINPNEDYHYKSLISFLQKEYKSSFSMHWKRLTQMTTDEEEDGEELTEEDESNKSTVDEEENRNASLSENRVVCYIKEGIWITLNNEKEDGLKWACSNENVDQSEEESQLTSRIIIFMTKEKEEEARDLYKKIKQFAVYVDHSSKLNRIHIVITRPNGGFDLISKKINRPEINLDLNYNDDFLERHQNILFKLNQNRKKGLVLLYGPPGTGKTSYIRYLLGSLRKRVIYIPPNLTNVISDPSFVQHMMEWSNSVLIIEDAENVITKRDKEGRGDNQSISNILNLSDGILSDCLNIQVVCTFNTDTKNIDEALLRKGRLIEDYQFGNLKQDKAKKLAQKIGVDPNRIDKDLPLSEIYNIDEEESYTTKSKKNNSKIGFNK